MRSGDTIIALEILVWMPHDKNSMGDLEANGRIILKYFMNMGCEECALDWNSVGWSSVTGIC
jgi:hypothetical protein